MPRSEDKEKGIHVPKKRNYKPKNRHITTRRKHYLIGGEVVDATVVEERGLCKPSKAQTSFIQVDVGYQIYTLLEELKEQWGTCRSEALRRLLLPLCQPMKAAIRGGAKNVAFSNTYSLDKDGYDRYTFR